MATTDGGRCSRADCLSLREELELLRGDLLELEAENEQLHDQLAGLQSDNSVRAAHTLQQMQEKDNGILRLQETVDELTKQLQQQLEMHLPSATMKASLSSEKLDLVPSEQDNEALKKQNERVFEGNFKDTQPPVDAEVTDALKFQQRGTQVDERHHDTRSELYATLKENEMLRAEIGKVEEETMKMKQQVEAYQVSFATMQDQLQAYRDAMDEQTLEMTQLHAKMEQLEVEKQTVEEKLIEMDERESDVDALMSDAKAVFLMEKAVLVAELDELRRKLNHHQQQQQLLPHQEQQVIETQATNKENATLSARAVTENLEKQLEMVQELRLRDKSTIFELNQRLLQQQSDLESLAEHVDVPVVVDRAVETALWNQKSRLEELAYDKMALEKQLQEQQEVTRELERRQGRLETQLIESQEWNAKYEQQAGLEEVVKHQKKVRAQLDQQQQLNVQLRQEVNDQMEAAGQFYVAFERLKAEVGKPAEFQYTDVELADHVTGQLAINMAVMKQMESHIQELEDERVRLLQKLRDQARLTGRKLYEQHGLTTAQWSCVEEFIERVKEAPEVAKRLLLQRNDEVKEPPVTIEESKQELGLVKNDPFQSDFQGETSQCFALVTTQPVLSFDNGRDDVLCALKTARAKLRQQDKVIEHLQAEIVRLRTECELERGDREHSVDPVDQEQELSNDKFVGSLSIQSSTETVSPSCADIEHVFPMISGIPPVEDKEESTNELEKKKENERESEQCTKLVKALELEPKGWTDHAETIAVVVAKAIEAQFALLQAPKAFSLQTCNSLDSPPIAASPPDFVSSCVDKSNERDEKAIGVTKRTLVDDLAFESEAAMIQEVDMLRQLNLCLDELVVVDARNEELQQQLHQHDQVLESLMDQHAVLYAHFFQLHGDYTAAEVRLRKALEEKTHETTAYKIKCQRYEAALHLLKLESNSDNNEAHLRLEVIDLTRQVAAYQVEKAQEKRKYDQLYRDYSSSTALLQLLQREWSAMETTLKYRVLYLETWKQGANEVMERMKKTLENSVFRDVADTQHRTMTNVLKTYHDLSEKYAAMQCKYLELYDLPTQLSHARHTIVVLEAAAKTSGKKAQARTTEGESTIILYDRIRELENELQVQVERGKEMEKARLESVLVPVDELEFPSFSLKHDDDILNEKELRHENKLLYDRIAELEQLYESLSLECTKYKEMASLAASQATVLSKRYAQEQSNRDHENEHVRDLMASSEDHAIVGVLQHQVMQMKRTYQQFLVQYEQLTDTQQQLLLTNQRLELEVEQQSQEGRGSREKARAKVEMLTNAVCQVKTRAWTARNTKWEAFRKRLDALEEEIQVEQQRRKQLEKKVEENHAFMPLGRVRPCDVEAGQVGQLQSRVLALETQERLLKAQLENGSKLTHWQEKATRLETEMKEIKTLNGELMQQLETTQARVAELLQQSSELQAEKRAWSSKFEEMELELQVARTERGWKRQTNEYEHEHAGLMRDKVGLYEQDQAQLQQAAQVTIASLKELVEEKNALLERYQRQLAAVRASSAQDKAQDRLETTQVNQKLYKENQRMIGQLQEAMETIHSLEHAGKSNRALQAAQDRHDKVLEEWEQAEKAVERAKHSIRELEHEVDGLRNERDLAEARAGEALEEIVLLKEKVGESERQRLELTRQVASGTRERKKKEDKLQVLREAIIKLKEEFFQAEDRHAIELARAQHARNHDVSARKRKERERRDEEAEAWQEEKTRLQSQVKLLQEKVGLVRKKNERQKKAWRREGKDGKEEEEEGKKASNVEVERLRQLLKDRMESEAKTVEALEKRVNVLEAQNLALREASTTGGGSAISCGNGVDDASEQLEKERKLQRRIDGLMRRVKEHEIALGSKAQELEQCQTQLSRLKTALEGTKKHEKPPSLAASQRIKELEQYTAFLRDTLTCKSNEWTTAFAAQMERYETQLQRLRRHLVKTGSGGLTASKEEEELRREEHVFVVNQALEEELEALGTELQQKEHEMVSKDMKVLDLELEVESLRVESKRLARKQQQQQEQGRGRSSVLAAAEEAGKRRRRGKKEASGAERERRELEHVIETMKKVMEKLRAENGNLKLKTAMATTTHVSPAQVTALQRKLKALHETREQLTKTLETVQHQCTALQEENRQLQQKLRALSRMETKLTAQVKEKERQVQKVEQERDKYRHEMEECKLQLQQDAANASTTRLHARVEALQAQVIELEDENTKLTNELAAFDDAFFEEIEDLKYKYAQALRAKRQLEKQYEAH